MAIKQPNPTPKTVRPFQGRAEFTQADVPALNARAQPIMDSAKPGYQKVDRSRSQVRYGPVSESFGPEELQRRLKTRQDRAIAGNLQERAWRARQHRENMRVMGGQPQFRRRDYREDPLSGNSRAPFMDEGSDAQVTAYGRPDHFDQAAPGGQGRLSPAWAARTTYVGGPQGGGFARVAPNYTDPSSPGYDRSLATQFSPEAIASYQARAARGQVGENAPWNVEANRRWTQQIMAPQAPAGGPFTMQTPVGAPLHSPLSTTESTVSPVPAPGDPVPAPTPRRGRGETLSDRMLRAPRWIGDQFGYWTGMHALNQFGRYLGDTAADYALRTRMAAPEAARVYEARKRAYQQGGRNAQRPSYSDPLM